MIEDILKEFGFPAFVAAVLLYDKLKTNNSLKTAVDNNTVLLKKILKRIE